jgi:hypothetical protein
LSQNAIEFFSQLKRQDSLGVSMCWNRKAQRVALGLAQLHDPRREPAIDKQKLAAGGG